MNIDHILGDLNREIRNWPERLQKIATNYVLGPGEPPPRDPKDRDKYYDWWTDLLLVCRGPREELVALLQDLDDEVGDEGRLRALRVMVGMIPARPPLWVCMSAIAKCYFNTEDSKVAFYNIILETMAHKRGDEFMVRPGAPSPEYLMALVKSFGPKVHAVWRRALGMPETGAQSPSEPSAQSASDAERPAFHANGPIAISIVDASDPRIQIVDMPLLHGCTAADVKCDDDDADDACAICLENKAVVVFAPCGHQHTCIACTRGLEKKECPTCRAPITTAVKVFK